jgi:serine/threonine protein kinase
MTTSLFDWPTKRDYDEAMLSLSQKIFDPEISKGKLVTSQLGRILSPGGANLYVCLYRIDDWIIRCFCRTDKKAPPLTITKRYENISTFCQNHSMSVSALLPITYIQKGIEIDIVDRDSYTLVKTAILPLVKMPFVKAPSLGRFIAAHYKDTVCMQQLANAWLHLIQTLECAKIAHGDLDLTNILVEKQGTGLTLKLIDYDNMWLPTLEGLEQTEYGHEPFQHPSFQPPNKRPYNAEMDRFSALVIYLSIKALAARPQLYQDWGADDTNRLLFTKKDYMAEIQNEGGHITELEMLNIPELAPYIQELCSCLHRREMPRSLTTLAPIDTKSSEVPPIIDTKSSEVPPIIDTNYSEELSIIDKVIWAKAERFKGEKESLIDVEEYKQKQAGCTKPLILPDTLPPTEPIPEQDNTPIVPAERQSRIKPRMVFLLVVILIVVVAVILVEWYLRSSSQDTSFIFPIRPPIVLSLSNHPLLLLVKSG